MPAHARKTAQRQQNLPKQHQQLLEELHCSSSSESGGEISPVLDPQHVQDMVDLGDEGGSGNSGIKSSTSLPPIPKARNAGEEAWTAAESLGSPVQVTVSVALADPGEVGDVVPPALPDPVPLTFSFVVPTITSETVSAVITIPASSNKVYEILKQAQID